MGRRGENTAGLFLRASQIIATILIFLQQFEVRHISDQGIPSSSTQTSLPRFAVQAISLHIRANCFRKIDKSKVDVSNS
jgi:hypothetical protein